MSRVNTILCTVFLLFLGACGVEPNSGGQSGGGETPQKVLISGKISSSSGEMLPSIEVIISENGVSTFSDQNGAFSFGEIDFVEKLTFIAQGDGFSAVSEPLALSEANSSISVKLILSADKSSLTFEEEGNLPGPTSTPSATPTPNSNSSFDLEGNTTSFGIPRGAVGNIRRGKSKYFSQCSACHSRLTGTHENFASLKRITAAPPMNLRLSDSTLADLVAYLRYSGGAR